MDYIRSLGLLVGVSAVCAGAASATMHAVQHRRWEEAYLLVPVNSFWLYFIPIAFSAAVWVAFRAKRLNAAMALGAALAWLWAGGRLAYWTWLASKLVGRPSVEDFRAVVREHTLSSAVVSVTGLLSFSAFALGWIRSVRRNADADVPDR